MLQATRSILRASLALLMIVSSVLCSCTMASPSKPVASTQSAEPPCCQHTPRSHDARTPADQPSQHHDDCPHCTGKLTADATPVPIAKHLADMPVLTLALPDMLSAVLHLNPPALSIAADLPVSPPAALPARLHCALVL
ncbi:MAG: hypothetical protein QM754_14775 [Tepidisphaeraceae bacterium]